MRGYGRSIFDDFFSDVYKWDRNHSESITEDKISIDLPGVKKEDLDIKCENRILKIKAKRYDNDSTYERSFVLNRVVDADNISAKLQDGVLQIEVPKLPETKPKEIPIRVE